MRVPPRDIPEEGEQVELITLWAEIWSSSHVMVTSKKSLLFQYFLKTESITKYILHTTCVCVCVIQRLIHHCSKICMAFVWNYPYLGSSVWNHSWFLSVEPIIIYIGLQSLLQYRMTFWV